MVFACKGQETTSDILGSDALYQSINKKVLTLQREVEEKSVKALERLQKQEAKLQKKLALKDSVAAKKLFAQTKYQQLTDKLQHPTVTKNFNEYIPKFDSLKTSLKFLEQTKSISDKLPAGFADKIKNVNLNVASLETKMQQAEEIKNYIKQRKEMLKAQLAKYDMLKDMKGLSKEAYYYQQQLNEYKAMLKDPKKLEQRAIDELKKLPAFASFMQKNSQLAQLFGIPANYGSAESLAGLQTRASIQNLLQQKFAGAGVNPQQYIQQQVAGAQGELSKLKDQLNKAGGGSSNAEVPEFTPNSQKTKTFLKRIEYGANIQTQRPNGILPVTSDLALTAGFKLNDKSIIGIGASYKMGWGNGFNSIKITHQGLGLRSYVDSKIKGSFWLSGGYELNYQQAFEKLDILKDLSSWQRSGLLGLTKKYKIGKKTNNMQLLWDFLSYRQVPSTQPIVFRVGYVF